jgi:hypothetical protein
MKFLELDFVSQRQQLYIFGKKTYKTNLGSILSILIILLSVLCFFGFGIDLLQKKKPEILLGKEFIQTPKISRSHFNFLISPQLRGGKVIPEVMRKLSFHLSFGLTDNSDPKNSTYFKEMELVFCNKTKNYKENIYNITSSTLIDSSISFCLSDDFTEDLIGKFGNNKFTVLNFFVRYNNILNIILAFAIMSP